MLQKRCWIGGLTKPSIPNSKGEKRGGVIAASEHHPETRERRPEHRTRNGTGTERERTGTRTREMLVQHLRHSRLPSAFLAAGKTPLGLHKDHLLCRRSICIWGRPQNASRISFPFSYLDAWPHFCLTSDLSAFCYRHKMQLGTPWLVGNSHLHF